MSQYTEILGVKSIILYINKDVIFRFPDPSKENEIDLIAHSVGSIVVDNYNETPRWFRKYIRMDGGKVGYIDRFTFNLHGLFNNSPEIIEAIKNNREGYILELINTNGKSLVFPSPVISKIDIEKEENIHSSEVVLTYAVPTFRNYYTKLNTIPMIYSYITVGDNAILGTGNFTPIVSN